MIEQALAALKSACQEAGVPIAESYSIEDAVKILELSYSWVYRAVRTGARYAVKADGRWMIPEGVLAAWLEKVQGTTERKRTKHLDPDAFYRERRPSHIAIRMVRRKVLADSEITSDQRELFLCRLDAYLKEWDDRA